MFVKIIYRHFVFNQEKYQVCKFRIYRHFVKSVNGSNFPVNRALAGTLITISDVTVSIAIDVIFLLLVYQPKEPYA